MVYGFDYARFSGARVLGAGLILPASTPYTNMLDEPPHTLIQSAIEGFETQPDLLSLERVGQMQAQLAEVRSQKLTKLETEVLDLEARLAQALSELQALSTPNPAIFEALGPSSLSASDSAARAGPDAAAAHEDVFKLLNSRSVELDTEKVALAKQLTELESSINQMSMAKIKLVRQKEEYERQKEQALAANVANNFNTTAMKIALFNKMGVHIESQDSRDKVMVFDRATDAASLLEIDPKYSDYFISNYIWDRLGKDKS